MYFRTCRGSVRLTYRKPPHPLLLLANLRQLMLPWQQYSAIGKTQRHIFTFFFNTKKEKEDHPF